MRRTANRAVNAEQRIHEIARKVPTFLAIILSIACSGVLAQVNYTRTSFTGTYTPISGTAISGGTGSGQFSTTSGASNNDDGAAYIALPFAFTYNGTNYSTSNYLGICTNGFVYFSTLNTNASKVVQLGNDLATTTAPASTARIVAPWWDDLMANTAVNGVTGSVQWAVSGSPGSQVLTVQYGDYPSQYNGTPRSLNFQVKLYETTHVIEFWYGSVAEGTISGGNTSESASAGLKSATGGYGQFIDGITGSGLVTSKRMHSGNFPKRHLRFTPGAPSALGVGTYTVGTSGTYPSLSEAVAEVNHRGVSGAVTFSLLDANYDETVPNGANIFPVIIAPIAGSSASNTVEFVSNLATSTLTYNGIANGGAITSTGGSAVTGTANEPIIGLVGADYVTLRKLTLGTSGNLLDRGIVVTNLSNTNGAADNTVQDVTITLNRTNTSTIAIEQRPTVTPTSAAGANSTNSYLNLTVRNTYNGINLTGNASFPDLNCQVSSTACGTYNSIGDPATANDIGNGTALSYGILASNQSGVTISNNGIRNVTVSGSVAVDGITALQLQGTNTISNNKVRGIRNASASAGTLMSGIRVGHSTTGTVEIRVYNNSISDITSGYTGSAVTTKMINGIYLAGTSGSTSNTYSVYNNSVSIDGSGSPNMSSACLQTANSASIFIIRNNVLGNFTGAQGATAKHFGVFHSAATTIGGTGSSVSNNDIWIANDVPSSGYTAQGNTTNYNGVGTWAGAITSPAGSVTSNFEVDPFYTNNASDLHAGNAVLNSGGTAPPGYITQDLDCATRTPDNDIGAYIIDACTSATAGSISGAPSACAPTGNTLNLVGASSGLGVSYQWKYGSSSGTYPNNLGTGNTQSTSSLPPGTYYFIVEVTCSSGPVTNATPEFVFTMYATPTVAPSSNSPVCTNGTLNLSAGGSGGTSWAWTGPNGFTSNVENPSIASPVLAATGTYSVTAIANGCSSAPGNAVVVVNPLPAITSVTATPNPTCFNGNSQLNVVATVDAPYVRISEMVILRGGTGSQASFPPAITGADLVELNNTSSVPADISGWTFSAHANNNATASHSITFASGTVIQANSWIVVTLGAGTNDPANGVYYTGGTNDSYASSSAIGLILRNGATIIDVMGAANSPTIYTFAPATGVTGADWSGSVFSITGRAGFIRSASVDSNTGSDWVVMNTPSPLSTIGAFNPGYSNPGQPASIFLWTPNTFLDFDNIANPQASNVNVASQAYSVQVSSAAGCSATGGVTLTTSAPITAATISGTLSFCAGGNTTLTAVPTDGAGPFSYLWGQGETTASIIVAAGGSYNCQVSDNCGGSDNTGSVIVVEIPVPLVGASNDGPKCSGENVQLTGTTDIPGTYQWTGPNGFTSADQNPLLTAATTLESGTYTFTTSAAGCTSLPATTTVSVAGPLSAVSVSPAAPTICPGGSVALTASGASYPGVFGTGNVVNTGTTYPTPYGAYFESVRTQYLILASELAQRGFVGGSTITGLTFTVQTVGTSGIHTAYKLTLGHTAASALSVTGWQTVPGTPNYGPVNYQPVAGSNTHTFTTPFIWNGTDNVVVDICHSNDPPPDSGTLWTNNAIVPASTTPFTSVIWKNNDNLENCGTLLVPTGSSTARANITLLAAPSYTWTPNTALDVNTGPTVNANPSGTTPYLVTATFGACSASAPVTVSVAIVDDGDPCTLDECSSGVVTHTFQDADGDLTCDANDGCPLDPLKTSPGLCGCGVAEGTCLDCLGVLAGPDVPGAPCDDSDDCTTGDVWSPICVCAGTFQDTDGDSVCDADDQCPGSNDLLDTDGDAVIDCLDACPADPFKIVPGQCGCGTADTDTDLDGTADCIDGCPIDPAKTAPGLCGCGAIDLDVDNNNVCDYIEGPPHVKLGIVESAGNELELRLLPDDDFAGLVSGTVITVRWPTTAGASITGSSAQYVNPAYGGPIGSLTYGGTTTDGAFSYATFFTIGNYVLSDDGLGWTGGVEIPFFRVPYVNTGSSCVSFEVVNDTYQTAENLQWFISLGALERTDGFITGETAVLSYPPVHCQDISVTLPLSGTIGVTPEEVNTSFIGCPPVSLSLDVSTFTCNELGPNPVVLTAIANSVTTQCNATITVVSGDADGDLTLDCEDGCPLDPLKVAPGICGCGNVDIDLDNDLVCDADEDEPNMKVGIVEAPGSELEIRLLPDHFFNDLVSGTVVTVRWLTTPGVSITGASAQYVDPAYAPAVGSLQYGGTTTDGLYSYANFFTIGNAHLSSEGLAWTANVEVPFFRVPYVNTGNACVTFEVLDDTYQIDNNLQWFISLNALDMTNGYITGETSVIAYPPVHCQDISVTLPLSGVVSVTPEEVNTSFIGCPPVSLSLDVSTFTCNELGPNPVVLTAIANSVTTQCNATITVVSGDADGDLTLDCEDGCPLDPLKVAPGICGCGNVDIDLDNDLVCDADEDEPNMKVGIVEAPGNKLEVRLLPDHFFNDLVSGTVVTVRWLTTPGVSITGASAQYVDPAYAPAVGSLQYGGTTTDGLYSYANFFTIGNAHLSSEGLAWTANVEVPFFRVPYVNTGSACVTFEVLDDTYQIDNNLQWFISLNALDMTNGYIAGETSVIAYPPVHCQDVTVTLPLSGTINVNPEEVNTSFIGCPPVSLSLDVSTFTCNELGPNPVVLTAIANSVTTNCNATITVIDGDADLDGTNDCSDGCPTDPLKIAPGICGCGNVDIDLDNDLVCDADEDEPNMQLGIVTAPGGQLELRILPDHFFNDLVSGTVITIRWETNPDVSVTGAAAAYVDPAYAPAAGSLQYGGTTTDGIYSYATFFTIGNAHLSSEGISWSAGVEVPFFRVPYVNSGLSCVTFEVLDDTYQLANNLQWFVSLNAVDKTNGYIPGKTSVCADPSAVTITARVILEGGWETGPSLMRDNLRSLVSFPLGHPYASAPFSHSGTETTTPAVLAVTGSDAIVDWVLLELRNPTVPAVIEATRAALVQRDGDIVDMDGTSAVSFNGTTPGSYYLAVRHRNHLGIMTAAPVAMGPATPLIDLTLGSTPTYGVDARKTVGSITAMWAGNVVTDDRLKYTGVSNDRDPILVAIGGSIPTNTLNGYLPTDVTLNGQTKYTGVGNDRDPILVNIGGSIPTAIRLQQLP